MSRLGTTSTTALRVYGGKRAIITVLNGPQKDSKFILSKSPSQIGHHKKCDIVLNDSLISDFHLRLIDDGIWWVAHDNDSRHGSFLNGKLLKSSNVFPGDNIQIGNTKIRMDNADTEDNVSLVKRHGEWVQIPRMIAHELKNYLQFLDIGVEHLKNDPDVLKRYENEIQSLHLASKNINELIHLLRAGCITPEIKRTDISDIIWQQLALLESYAQDNAITLNTKIDDTALMVRCDESQIGRAFLNFLKNSFEACGNNDTITVSVKRKDRFVIVSIKDTGCGMNLETMEGMFVPLFTTKPEGNGLGAFIARTIILKHHGGVQVQSKPGQGTHIRIMLPYDEKTT